MAELLQGLKGSYWEVCSFRWEIFESDTLWMQYFN